MKKIVILISILLWCCSCTDMNVKNKISTTSPQGRLLFENPTFYSCKHNAHYTTGPLLLENNLWNIKKLIPGSYSQCIYSYKKKGTRELLGWQWSFPVNARGVNAYPEVIYGWKPWMQSSTTKKLPKQIKKLSKASVSYATELYVERGEYNLAFDIWICNAPQITPGSIRFELMIWEDMQILTPFGAYQGTVTTSYGRYRLYRGEPDWEPAGSNWTYLAFTREKKRRGGQVNIEELLSYLIKKKIMSPDYYLATIEFGNEIGNSKGYCVLKKCNIQIQ